MNRAILLIWTVLVCAAAPVLFLVSVALWISALGSDHWERYVPLGILAGLGAISLVVVIMEIRRLAWQWLSPIFSPLIWTCVTGFCSWWVLLLLLDRPWNEHVVNCDPYGVCTTSSELYLPPLLFTVFISVFTFGPFLRSVYDLYGAFRTPPTRFVSRRRLH